jgi:predicted dithiol-disulfide oxidoreductase (DUF899 family)
MTRAKRFPNETAEYDVARARLLEAERELRRSTEAVAAQRRALPPGGVIPEDYELVDVASGTTVRFSELFGPEHDTLVIYSYMYGPAMEQPCGSCTSILDSLDGAAPHLTQRVNLAVIAKSPAPRIGAFAQRRGWRNLRLLSSAGTTFNRDYLAEEPDGSQLPMLHVFRRAGGEIRHTWSTELVHLEYDEGQDPRHLDMIWPVWGVLDATPDGRGTDWNPSVSYAT